MQKKSTLTFPFLRRLLARALTRGSRARAPSMAVTREQVRTPGGSGRRVRRLANNDLRCRREMDQE